MIRSSLAALCLLGGSFAIAQTEDSSEAELRAEYEAYAAQLQDSLTMLAGRSPIQGGKASVDLSDDYRYLQQADARKVLEELWGNPPDESVLGLIIPAQGSLIGAQAWAVAISYQDDGHVDDEDAAGIDYAELLVEMQEGTREANEARQQAGYGSIELVGWAEQPRYDEAEKKMYWAKELIFDASANHTLNYDVRILGRDGVLVMSAIASMDNLPEVRRAMQQVLAQTEFDAGARYADYNPKTDRLASYGVAALVAGGLASKTGLLAKLGVLLLSLKKFLVLFLIGAGLLVKKLFTGKGSTQAPN